MMEGNSRKLIGIMFIFAGLAIAMVNIMLITNFSILDTNPTTYVIVPMLMLFALLIFSLKEKLVFSYNKRNVLFGLVLFIIYILLISYLRGALSSVFGTYGIYALILPVLISSFVIIFFGIDGIKRLKTLIIYSLFCSPLILMPILYQNSAFANANAYFVYDVLKLFGAPVSINGIVITSALNTSISIATTCAPLGIFAALVMFLVPVAYLYEGKLSRKALWILSGIVLLLLFNLMRMFVISLSWAYYGIGPAVTLFHIFAGQILFYIAIIAMLLVGTKYGLVIKRIKKGMFGIIAKDFGKRGMNGIALQSFLVIVLGVIGLLFTLPYLNIVNASPTFFYNEINSTAYLYSLRGIGSALSLVSSNVIFIGSTYAGAGFALVNQSNLNNSVYVIANVSSSPSLGRLITNYTDIYDMHSYILRNGITLHGAIEMSGNLSFDVDYFAIPYNVSGGFVSVDYEVFKLETQYSPCKIGYSSIGAFNYIESMIYNILNGRLAYSNSGFICKAYELAEPR